MNVSVRRTVPSEAEELSQIQKAAFKSLYEKYHDERNPYLRGPEDIPFIRITRTKALQGRRSFCAIRSFQTQKLILWISLKIWKRTADVIKALDIVIPAKGYMKKMRRFWLCLKRRELRW